MKIGIKDITVKNYDTPIKKLKGLMFKQNFNYGIRLRCNGIHTFFMKENIDVILTDKNDIILKIYYNLKPNRIVFPKKNVYYTYELPAGFVKGLNINDKLK